ncbi:hypothetical protein KP509_11G065300 [Ceratopteris richardii]|uniref:Uncharacterized protein n=1 Tax=Ceratopteris richardii TaxID=49495 RepID=A0A8T2TVN6_CERRI|nr:hypothetical protein KP509_11G065300 [Ceratopteris richardii]
MRACVTKARRHAREIWTGKAAVNVSSSQMDNARKESGPKDDSQSLSSPSHDSSLLALHYSIANFKEVFGIGSLEFDERKN